MQLDVILKVEVNKNHKDHKKNLDLEDVLHKMMNLQINYKEIKFKEKNKHIINIILWNWLMLIIRIKNKLLKKWIIWKDLKKMYQRVKIENINIMYIL